MQVKFSALGGAVRKSFIQVVVNAKDPNLGFGSIKVRALPALHFDFLWGDLTTAELALAEAKGAEQEALAAEEKRGAEDTLVRAMVIGHEPTTFKCEFEVPELIAEKDELAAQLEEMGFSPEEAAAGVLKGSVSKAFKTAPLTVALSTGDARYEGASQETVLFYRHCQPYEIFFKNLLVALHQFQNGATRTAQEIWEKNAPKVKEEVPSPLAIVPSEEA